MIFDYITQDKRLRNREVYWAVVPNFYFYFLCFLSVGIYSTHFMDVNFEADCSILSCTYIPALRLYCMSSVSDLWQWYEFEWIWKYFTESVTEVSFLYVFRTNTTYVNYIGAYCICHLQDASLSCHKNYVFFYTVQIFFGKKKIPVTKRILRDTYVS
jgi:hypothetical protein